MHLNQLHHCSINLTFQQLIRLVFHTLLRYTSKPTTRVTQKLSILMFPFCSIRACTHWMTHTFHRLDWLSTQLYYCFKLSHWLTGWYVMDMSKVPVAWSSDTHRYVGRPMLDVIKIHCRWINNKSKRIPRTELCWSKRLIYR